MQMKMACQTIAHALPDAAVHGPSMQQNQVRTATRAERFDIKAHRHINKKTRTRSDPAPSMLLPGGRHPPWCAKQIMKSAVEPFLAQPWADESRERGFLRCATPRRSPWLGHSRRR